MSIGSKLGGMVFRASKATIGFVAADLVAPVGENVVDFTLNAVGIKTTTKDIASKISSFIGSKVDGLKLAKGERAIMVVDDEVFVMPRLSVSFSVENLKAKASEAYDNIKAKKDARFSEVGTLGVYKVTEAQAQAITVAKKAKEADASFDLNEALTSILGPDFINAGAGDEVGHEPSCDEINENANHQQA